MPLACRFFLFFQKTDKNFGIPLAKALFLWYTVNNKIYLIESNVVTGTMMLQQPAEDKSEIGDDAMGRISSLSSPSPVLAVVRKPSDVFIEDPAALQDIFSTGGLYLALDGIRDPGNLGTIMRIADWFGIDAIFATRDTVDVYNPKVVQATMGAIFRVKIHYVDLPALSRVMLASGGKVYGTFLDGENMYERPLETGKESPVMIVIGNESEGISDRMEALVSDRLYIPPYPAGSPGSESLNAAIATAITVAEFRRR